MSLKTQPAWCSCIMSLWEHGQASSPPAARHEEASVREIPGDTFSTQPHMRSYS